MKQFANTDHFLLRKQHGDENVKYLPIFTYLIPIIQNSCVFQWLFFFGRNNILFTVKEVVFGFSCLADFWGFVYLGPLSQNPFEVVMLLPPFLPSWSVLTFIFSSKIPYPHAIVLLEAYLNSLHLQSISWRSLSRDQGKEALPLCPSWLVSFSPFFS